MSDFGFRIPGFGVQVSGFRIRISCFGFRVYRVYGSGFQLRVHGSGFRDHVHRVRYPRILILWFMVWSTVVKV